MERSAKGSETARDFDQVFKDITRELARKQNIIFRNGVPCLGRDLIGPKGGEA